VSKILRRPAANRDLVASFRYYAREAGLRVAGRFFAEAEATFIRLARMPEIGTRYGPLYADLRHFPVSRLRDHLVFYRALPNGIVVFRVVHGARDVLSILAGALARSPDADEDKEGGE
jgi:toxin ParE1/3/4